jgi:hypothetical protein
MTLINRLREWEGEYHYPAGLMTEAADALQRLEEEAARLRRFHEHCREHHALPAHCCPPVGGAVQE